MAAGFTLVDSEESIYGGVETVDTTLSFTPAVGDIIKVMLRGTQNTPEIASAGATYSKETSVPWRADAESAAVFRCTGAGSADNLTISVSFADTFTGHLVQIVRPVDLDYVGKAGQNQSDSTSSLTVSLTTSSPAALLGFGAGDLAGGFTSDTGWTTLDEIDATLDGICEYRLSDDTEFIVDPANTIGVFGSAFEFSAAATDPASLTESPLIRSRLTNTPLVRRSMEKFGNLWVPSRTIVTVPDLQFAR